MATETNYLRSSTVLLSGGAQLRDGDEGLIDKYIIDLLTRKPVLRLVFIPTASRDNEKYIELFTKTFRTENVKISILKMFAQNVSSKQVVADLAKADIIYLGGGDPSLYLRANEKYPLKSGIEAAIARGAIVYGLSAGATILGDVSINFEFSEGSTEASCFTFENGWRMLPFSVATHAEHYDQSVIVKSLSSHLPILYLPSKAIVIVTDNGKLKLLRSDPKLETILLQEGIPRIIA